jgi:exopolysaccharide production protein ExoZ
MLVTSRPSETLLSIQALRAIAALGVLVFHIVGEISNHLGSPGTLPDFTIGAAGVDLFFVISGFIIVYASEALFGKPQGPSVFFRRRLIRIVPLYWAVTIVYLSFFLLAHSDFAVSNNSISTIIASFVFLPYPKPDGSMLPVHMLGWTLNYEMFFYAVFAISVMLSRQRALAATAALLASVVALGHLFAPLPQPFAFWSDPIILEFCFGMMLALAYRAGVRLPRAASCGLLIGAILAFGATKFRGIDLAWRTLEWGLPAAALVGALVLSREGHAPGVVGRLFLFLGSASYSLYLVHPIVFAGAKRLLFDRISLPAFPWSWGMLLFALSVTAACLVYLLFEKPVTHVLQRTFGGRPRGYLLHQNLTQPVRHHGRRFPRPDIERSSPMP